MKRLPSKSQRARSVMFETLQPRELLAADTSWIPNNTLAAPSTAEQWASAILSGYENSGSRFENQPVKDLRKFASEAEAQKYLVDALLSTWQDVLGKPVDNHFNIYSNSGDFRFYIDSTWETNSLMRTNSASSFGNATNNQVTSVDEADQLEVSSDGYVYALETGQNSELKHVVIFDAHDPKNLQKVATIAVKGFSTQMHLVDNQLILVTSDYSEDVVSGSSHIQTYDISDRAKPILQTDLTVSGARQQSRFVDGKLILLGNQSTFALRPLFISENPTAAYASLSETPIGRFETANEFVTRVQPMVLGWMLPDVKAAGSNVELSTGDWKDLVAGSNDDFHHRLSVLTFGLSDGGLKLIDSESILGAATLTSYVDGNTIYASQSLNGWRPGSDAIQIAPPETEIYAIQFNADKVEFVAAGIIPGTVLDSRMMDEYQGNLRVFSDVRGRTPGDSGRASSDLYILQPNAGKLEIIGQLNDVADGQALYSAYFDKDQALITTGTSEVQNLSFVRGFIDPLHGFDLSDPTKPKELSELVIPGMSRYLQRVDAAHIVGIGYNEVSDGDWRQQVSLYDVSDLKNLKVVDTWTSPNNALGINFSGWSPFSHSVNFDPLSGLFSVAFSAFGSFTDLGLTVFKIDPSGQDPLHFLAKVGDENTIASRSAVVGDVLYLTSDVWLQAFSTNDLSVELDRELLTSQAVADWTIVEQSQTAWINVLENDHSTGGHVTAISKSKLGATVAILNDGATIQYKAPDHVGSNGVSEELTYTVTLEDGKSYEGTITVSTNPLWSEINPPHSNAQAENVIANVSVVDDKGDQVEQVKQGEEYWIEVKVSDGRASPQGVYASYVNVNFDPTLLAVEGAPEGIGVFQNGVHGGQTKNGTIESLGAFSNTTIATNEATSRVARIRVRAQVDGYPSLFATQSLAVGEETILYGLNTPINNVSLFSPYYAPLVKAIYVAGDVNGDGYVSPLDALLLLNQLNLQSEQINAGAALGALNATTSMMDISADGMISPLDLMMLVNLLSANAAVLLASGEASNDSVATSSVDEVHVKDQALISLMAPNYTAADDVLIRSRMSNHRG